MDEKEALEIYEKVNEVARHIFENDHRGRSNVWGWNDEGLDNEHPGARDRYIRYAQSAIDALTPPQDLSGRWPHRLTLRDTNVYADEGQRIYTTATGHGYERRDYVRSDLAYSLSDALHDLLTRPTDGAARERARATLAASSQTRERG